MEYFYSFQRWLYDTRLYQEILKELPIPLNNIYFDSVIIIILAFYLIYRILEAIYIACYRRHIRKRQEKERKQQMEKEKEMMYREIQVHQKEQKFDRFMDYMELLYANRTTDTDEFDVYEPTNNHDNSSTHKNKHRRKRFFLGKKDRLQIAEKSVVPKSSDYDVVMDAVVYEAKQEEEINLRQEAEMEQMFSKINALNDELRVRASDESMERDANITEDPMIRKRKEKARREEEKEQRKAEKLLRKKQKIGGWYGRFNKKS